MFPARPARKQTVRFPTALHPPKRSPPCQPRHRHHHRSDVHQCLIPSRRCSWVPGTPAACCHALERPFLRSPDLRVLSCHRVRCKQSTLPPIAARGSLGLSSRIRPVGVMSSALPARRRCRALPKDCPPVSSREPPRRVARGRPPPKGGGCHSEERQHSSRTPGSRSSVGVRPGHDACAVPPEGGTAPDSLPTPPPKG